VLLLKSLESFLGPWDLRKDLYGGSIVACILSVTRTDFWDGSKDLGFTAISSADPASL
jgi:hypothetical protein